MIATDEVETFFNKGSRVRALIQCTGFWIAAGKFGLSWKLKQMIIEPSARIGKAYAFNDEEEDSAPAPAAKPAVVQKKVEAPVMDDEDEDDDAEAEAPAVKEEPVVETKKIVRKVVAKK
jgi:hypothetical protein